LRGLRSIPENLDVRPTEQVPVIRWAHREASPRLVTMRWGFIPYWWKDEKPPTNTINARCEEAPGKPVWARRGDAAALPGAGNWLVRVDTNVDPETGEVRMKRGGKEPFRTPMMMSEPAPKGTVLCRTVESRDVFAANRSRPVRSSRERRSRSWQRSTTACR